MEHISQAIPHAIAGIMPGSQTATPTGQNVRHKAKAQQPEVDAMFADFKTFNEPSLCESLTESKRFCLAMASGDQPARWLVLLGKSGTGKTMLARRCSRFFRKHLDGYRDENQPGFAMVREHATNVAYRKGGLKSWSAVMQDVLDGDYSGIRDLRDDWFVCLDDIGAEYERNRELSVSKLYDVLNGRDRKFTIVTANLTLSDIGKKMDVRIASRLLRHGNVVVDVECIDFNLR